ncbi:hypothetical protein ABZM97_13320 [Bacillus vallismortis]|uniref:Tyr recombinase domain-containing protein n=1 Tax=Bacillus vallismortis TaxID=72361 RepID=A0ABY4XV91_BACVA|nr:MULTISPECIES: hypothetical protein [Bacillus]USP94168.1 hypothetical protein MKF32_12925 [Bacillus vallismortis]
MLFVTGINSGPRISDILQLRVRDEKRPYFNLIEKKTKKKIDMTPALQREFKTYVEGKEDHEFLFKSREGINKPISGRSAFCLASFLLKLFHPLCLKLVNPSPDLVFINVHFSGEGSLQLGTDPCF